MAYIGNTATTQAFTPAVDYFNGDGATVAFTLSKPVASVAQVQAVIENVPQNPGSAYTVSGNTITFTSAPPSGTANIYVYYTSPITQVIAPSQGTVDSNILATLTTLPAPGSNTLTLPSASGTIDRLNRAGNVLQVVNVAYATDTFISTTTLTDTGLTASITPTSASSKILVLVNLNIGLNRETNAAIECKAQLLRGATQIVNMGATNGLGFRIGAGTDAIGRITLAGMLSLSYLDSPATTSSTTYKMQAAPSTTLNAGGLRINWGGDVNSTITLMEIAA